MKNKTQTKYKNKHMSNAPLSLSLNNADTSMPLLVEGKYPFVIDKAEIVVSQSGKGSFLAVHFKTTEDAMSSKGQPLKAGFTIVERYMLPIPGTQFGDGEQASNYMAKLCRFMLAVANLKDTAENKAKLPEFNEDYVLSIAGTVVIGNVKTAKAKEDDEFGDSSKISAVYPIG